MVLLAQDLDGVGAPQPSLGQETLRWFSQLQKKRGEAPNLGDLFVILAQEPG